MSPARWIVSLAAAFLALGAVGCAAEAEDDDASSADAVSVPDANLEEVRMTDAERAELVEKKVTCPFVGAMVKLKKLPVLNSLGNPLARLSDIKKLGDEAGGNLGSLVLWTFARGNHHRMHAVFTNAAGGRFYSKELLREVPEGTFSLDFPPSQGSHPGHSGILQEGRSSRYQGGFNRDALERFKAIGVDEDGRHAGDAGFAGAKYIRRRDLGDFIVANVKRDPESIYLGQGLLHRAARDVKALALFPSVERLVALTGTDNMIGSAGEFGLLMTFLEVPDLEVDGSPVMRVDDVERMFAQRELPEGYRPRPLESHSWVWNTTAILASTIF